MTKILKPYTIIPRELYVHRDADRQIRNIIRDMGRPGYVLVSRQMGKTNLLLNAKRELETPEDVFIYIDLSNPFDDARSCFENIIDNAIDTNYEKFSEVSEEINERRIELRNTPPHKQHTYELRKLIKLIEGKLVIILDEIDALTKTNYSDQIFAQIRSIYFSRINYSELERLTYILSGVIEPNEIIKDPKISPFNIGQKIFLNDFNEKEFRKFLEKSNLTLIDEITERVFYWTGGNPRMTWDVCSEIENYLKHSELTIETIDNIVNEIYLTTFDKPPIDNIRELVRKDRDIRNSIVEIEYRKGKAISDKIKSKLYLSGIINYEDKEIEIKNEIIRQSISLAWIKSIEEEEKGLVKIAIELFEKQEYDRALSEFERFLENDEFGEEERSICYYYMGFAAYSSLKFSKALQYLDNTNFEPDEGKMYYRILNLKGLVHYYNNNIDKSLSCFKEVMQSGRKDESYARALLNFGSMCLKSDKPSYKDEAIRIFEGIIDETGLVKEKLKEDFVKELKSISHYNLAQIQVESGEIEEARSNYFRAIEFGRANTKPSISLALLDTSLNEKERFNILNEVVSLVESREIAPIENDPERPLDFSFDEFREILIIAFLEYPNELFDKLKSFLPLLGEKGLGKHIYDLAMFSINVKQNWETAQELLTVIYDQFENPEFNIDQDLKYRTLKVIAYHTQTKKSIRNHIEYLEMFAENRLGIIDNIDLEIAAQLIFQLTNDKKYERALNYVNLISSVKDSVHESNLINYLVIYHLELNLYALLKRKKEAINKAEEIIRMANDPKIKKQNSNLLGEKGLDVVKQNAEAILINYRRLTPIGKSKKYSRNQLVKVRYSDGRIIETKYKKIENDLQQEKCFILN